MYKPLLFTQEGRDQVKSAKERKESLEKQRRLNKAEQFELGSVQKITRRDLLEKVLLIGGGIAVGGYAISRLTQDTDDGIESIQGPERFVQLTLEINKSGLGTATWAHPEGATDEHPRNPVIFVGFSHGSPLLTVTEKHLQGLHNTFKIMLLARKCNMRKFNLEGTANEPFPKEDVQVGDHLLTPKECREYLSDFDNFKNEIGKQSFPQIQGYIAACLEDGIDCRGLDDPAKEQERLHYLHQVYEPAMQRANALLDDCERTGMPSFERDASGRITRATLGSVNKLSAAA